MEFHCKEERNGILSLSTHAGPMVTGQIHWTSSDPGKWVYVIPGTQYETMRRFVCSRQGGPQEDVGRGPLRSDPYDAGRQRGRIIIEVFRPTYQNPFGRVLSGRA